MPTSPPQLSVPLWVSQAGSVQGDFEHSWKLSGDTSHSCQALKSLQFQTKLVPEATQAQGSSFSAVSKGFKVNTHMNTVE